MGIRIAALAVVFLLLGLGARRRKKPLPWIHILFFFSGFPALLYQIVWQRALFAIYGLNIQSVTIVVSAFLLGLGLGSLAGGALSVRAKLPPVAWFAIAELGTAAFGFGSLRLFRWIGEFTAGRSLAVTWLAAFSLIVIPTMLMGATLPLLVEHLARSARNIGASVGGLYFANTLGSGFACFVAANFLMRTLGQSGSVQVAGSVNALVGVGALIQSLRARSGRENMLVSEPSMEANQAPDKDRLLPFPLALTCTAFCGFAALAYEIIWYRLLTFGAGDTAPVFAFLLGSYLLGLALGARFAERYSERNSQRQRGQSGVIAMLARVLFASALFGFAVGPGIALAMKFVSPLHGGPGMVWAYRFALLSICFAAFFFGASFPLLAQVSVGPRRRAGAALSFLYAANIAGSTLGSFIVGFILMDHLSLFAISLLLLLGGFLIAILVLATKEPASQESRRGFTIWASLGVAATLLVVIASRPVLNTVYDRLLFKNQFPRKHFQEVVENRSGTIGVTADGTVFGGGVYDGRFNVSLIHDVNIVIRPYALGALHPAPRHVLIIGLGSGSWAQIVAHHPQLEDLTVVEINPGYLKLIPQHAAVASLLKNPKVRIVIDDGRRWLLRNSAEHFDAIVMNTTFFWRNHASNLLSVDFLQLARKHLNPGGVLFYNTTGSNDVMATGLAVFPHAFRFSRCLAVSDAPIVFDRVRWRAALLAYTIDGARVIDPAIPAQAARLDEVVNIKDDPTGRDDFSVESDQEVRARLQGFLTITDDNMGVEWR